MKKINATIIFNIIIGLFEVCISIAIFDYTYSSFETIVVALLLIIYTTIRKIGIGLSHTIIDLTFGVAEEFKRTRTLSHPDNLYDVDSEDKKIPLIESTEKIKTKNIINLITLSIIYVIAILHLISSL